MSFGEYLGGVVGLAAVAVPIAMAGVRLRRRLLPGWVGAPARLAEAVLAVALLTVLLQLLGAFGILVPAVLIPAALLVGLGVYYGFWVDYQSPKGSPPPTPDIPLPQLVLALGAAIFVASHWATGLQDVWARGMLTFDTLWYHGPFAARIADTGSVWGMHFTDPLYLNWFYPENSELLHGAGIVLIRARHLLAAGQLRLARSRLPGRLVHRASLRRRTALADGGRDRHGHRPDGPARGGHAGHGHRPGGDALGRRSNPDQRLGRTRIATSGGRSEAASGAP